MKTFANALLVLLLGALTACQLPLGGTGSLKISLPSPGRAVTANAGKGDLVRIQLNRNGVIVPLSGQDYLEQGLAGQTVTLDGLPTGTGYTLIVATGSMTANFFEVGYAQTSAPFEISAGVDTAVSVALSPTPIQLLNAGAAPHSAVAYLGTDGTEHLQLAGLNASQSSLFDGSTVAALGSPSVPNYPGVSGWTTGAVLRSLGRSIDPTGVTSNEGVFYNTDQGLGTYSAPTFDFKMYDDTGVLMTTKVPKIDASGSFQVTVTGTPNKVYTLNVYAGPGLSAGLSVVDTSSTTNNTVKWYNLETLLQVDTLPSTVRDSLQNTDRLVRDFVATKDFAYLSTALGTYRVDSGMLSTSDAKALGDKFVNREPGVVLNVVLEGRTLSIGPVSAFESGTGGLVFAGTSKGLFSAPTGNDGAATPIPNGLPTGDLMLVPGTYGLDIATLATYRNAVGGASYTAAYSANSREVLVVRGLNQIVARFPALAGLPTGKLSLAWWKLTDGSLELVISGDNATVIVKAN